MATSQEKQDWHNRGEQDVANGRVTDGRPWPGVFESHDDYQDRLEHYEQGMENGYNNQNNK